MASKSISLHNVRGIIAYRKPHFFNACNVIADNSNNFRGLNFCVGLLTHEIREN